VLSNVFRVVGSYALVGPHSGNEAQSLIAGSKSLALIPSAYPDEIGGGPHRAHLDSVVSALEPYVACGRLLKHSESVSHVNGSVVVANFYAQADRRADLEEIVAWHRALWAGTRLPRLRGDVGSYFGYQDNDIALWHGGGYDALAWPQRLAMKLTDGLRRYCRTKSMCLRDTPYHHKWHMGP